MIEKGEKKANKLNKVHNVMMMLNLYITQFVYVTVQRVILSSIVIGYKLKIAVTKVYQRY